jgi:hypothetical protein
MSRGKAKAAAGVEAALRRTRVLLYICIAYISLEHSTYSSLYIVNSKYIGGIFAKLSVVFGANGDVNGVYKLCKLR